jgi:hypothetical protein
MICYAGIDAALRIAKFCKIANNSAAQLHLTTRLA